MMSFLFRCLFFLDILFLGLLYTAKFPKRSHYPLRAALACIVGLAVSCGWAALFDGKPQLLGLYLLYESVGFFGQFFIALFSTRQPSSIKIQLGNTVWLWMRSRIGASI